MCQGGGVKQLGVFRKLHVAPCGWRTKSEAGRGRASPGSAELGAGAGHPGLWSLDIPLRTPGHTIQGVTAGQGLTKISCLGQWGLCRGRCRQGGQRGARERPEAVPLDPSPPSRPMKGGRQEGKVSPR